MVKKLEREREARSIKIDPELWKELRLHTIARSEPLSDFLERAIRKELKEDA